MTCLKHLVLPLAFGCLCCVSRLAQSDNAQATPSSDPAETSEAEEREPDPFAVPDGTAKELFRFINSVKRLRAADRSPQSMGDHLTKQVNSVLQAADRILSQDVSDIDAARAVEEKFVGLSILSRVKPEARGQLKTLAGSLAQDERPLIVAAADFQLLQLEIMTALQDAPVEDTIETAVFSFIDKHGLGQKVVALGSELGRLLERREPQLAARLLQRLATQLEQSADPDFAQQGAQMAGVARRLSLPGNFMDLSGMTANGDPFDWDSYRGKFVLVDFWASWCGPCRAEVPNVKNNLVKYGAKGFAVVGVNIDRNRNEFESYVDEAQITWDNIMPDPGGNSEMAIRYGVTGIPTVILVDPEGKVISVNARGPELGRLLEQHLGGAAKPETNENS